MVSINNLIAISSIKCKVIRYDYELGRLSVTFFMGVNVEFSIVDSLYVVEVGKSYFGLSLHGVVQC